MAVMDTVAGEKLKLLIRMVESLSEVEKDHDLVKLLLMNALEFTGAERGFLIQKKEDNSLICFDSRGEHIDHPLISLSSIHQVFMTGQSLCLIENADGETLPSTASILALDLKTIMCAPLFKHGENDRDSVFAVLYIDSRIVSRPFDRKDLEFLSVLTRQAAEVWHHLILNRRLSEDFKLLHQEVKAKYDYHNIVGQCDAMKEVYRILELIRDTDLDVMITGETGTGKELIAKAIHYASPRSGSPLKQINCAALPEGLVEAELFGVERNVATEVRSRQGKLEQADGGTLFLDEIGDMPIRIQNHLLRFLEERKFRRIGGREEIASNARVIAATNKNLSEEIKAGNFRDALRYRLEVVTIHLPPLRDRKDDLEILVDFFLKEVVEKHQLMIRGFTKDAWDIMREYRWPGNIRELKHRIQSAAFLAKSHLIDVVDLGLKSIQQKIEIKPLKIQREKLEQQLISDALSRHEHNLTQCAASLGISADILQEKIIVYQLDAQNDQ